MYVLETYCLLFTHLQTFTMLKQYFFYENSIKVQSIKSS